MAGNHRFAMDQNDIVRLLAITIDDFIRDRLINKEKRNQHKEQCAERLAAEDGCTDKCTEVRYSDQAVLANLDWGIEALEEALNTSNIETKFARLDHAEKMLQVCALLNSNEKTAGVPNFYLSAWAHLNLAYLRKLRGNVHNSVLHVLEMFIVDPFFSRIDFAPELWKDLFLPHMSSIIGWYSEERHRLVMEVLPDSSDLSFTADLDQFFNESMIFLLRPDQVERLQNLEQLYGESLDENTKLFAKYFKDCMSNDSGSSKKVAPMLPIAEPPMTPLHEVSRSIPDYVKFGPILPKSAGFSSIPKSRDGGTETSSRPNETSIQAKNSQKFAQWDSPDDLLVEKEDDSHLEPYDSYDLSDTTTHKLLSPTSTRTSEDDETGSKGEMSRLRSRILSPTIFSPIESPSVASPNILSPQAEEKSKSSSVLRLRSHRFNEASLPASPAIRDSYGISPAESDEDLKKTLKKGYRQTTYDDVSSGAFENSLIDEIKEEDRSRSSENLTPILRPPKDFVCPITGQMFCDPVTLETGQTYERKAIQEWFQGGNRTCPITRQPLSSTILPKTNSVLKKLITSWLEQHPDPPEDCSLTKPPVSNASSEFQKESSLACTPRRSYEFPLNSTYESLHQRSKSVMRAAISTSPTSVISQATVEKIINSLKPFISCLCDFENLNEREAAVLAIAGFLKDSKGDPAVHSYLSELTVVNGFVEMLLTSQDREVLRASIYILSELICADESVGESLSSLDSDFDCLASLLTSGLTEASVLMCQLRPTFFQLSAHDLIPSLVHIVQGKNKDLDDLLFVIEPTDAAIAMLEQILRGGDENNQSMNALSVVSANGIPALVKILDRVEVMGSILSILLCCMQAEKYCRNLVANTIELSLIIELLHAGNDGERGLCLDFLSELVKLNRTRSNQILQRIKDEGTFSTMHTLLIHLQMAPMEQHPAIASLLLQLDLLVEPRKMSLYREESIDALFEAMRRKDDNNSQMAGLEALLSLTGRLTSSGKPYTKAWLLKLAGFGQPHDALMKAERLRNLDIDLLETMEEEEKAVSAWEKRVAFVLCNHKKGYIFKVLKGCLKSDFLEMAESCLVVVSWLCYMLSTLPDTGVRDTARKYLLDEFVNILQSSKSHEEKILASLALKTYVSDPVALEELGVYTRSIYNTLRKLRRNSFVVNDIMKALMNLPSVDTTGLWNYTEVGVLDSCSNGEVMSLIHLNGRVLSSHSDGTIKVWDARKRALRLIQEARQHSKAVTGLCVSSSGNTLYSGSLDKTIRVWAIKSGGIQCVQVHEVKDAIYHLTANENFACFVSQGTGVKVYSFSGVPKHINFNKYVKSLALSEDKLYCGCSGDSIMEVDLSNYTTNSFYAGVRKLLWKQNIYSLHMFDDQLFAGGSTVDGTAGKIFSLSTKATLGSFPSGVDILHSAISTDLLFTASKCGVIGVWLREKFTKKATIKLVNGSGSHTKLTSLTSVDDGGLLLTGTSDGKIQVWTLL